LNLTGLNGYTYNTYLEISVDNTYDNVGEAVLANSPYHAAYRFSKRYDTDKWWLFEVKRCQREHGSPRFENVWRHMVSANEWAVLGAETF